jgi:hypothetical protein
VFINKILKKQFDAYTKELSSRDAIGSIKVGASFLLIERDIFLLFKISICIINLSV